MLMFDGILYVYDYFNVILVIEVNNVWEFV